MSIRLACIDSGGVLDSSTCIAPRIAPSKAYLLFDAHPPRMILYAPIDDMARKKSIPMLKLATITPGANGVDLQLSDTLRISGRLHSADGKPRRGVKVEAVGAADE